MARGKRRAEKISFHQVRSRKEVTTKTMSQRHDTIWSDSVWKHEGDDKRVLNSCRIEDKRMGTISGLESRLNGMEMGYGKSPGLDIFIYFSLYLLSCIALKVEVDNQTMK